MKNNNDSTILIVDDEPANIFLIDGLLTALDYKTITASSGTEALSILDEKLPDLILLDIMMPGLTGVEVLQEIQKDKIKKDIPVIMVSAKSASKDVEESLSLGAMDYIKKPIDDIELIARCKVALKLKFQEDKLRELIKSQEEFVKIISHDLRTPFTTIQGFAELLQKEENLSEEQKFQLGFIIEASGYSVEYFNKLLNWSQLGAKEIMLLKSEINVKPFLETTILLYKQKASEKKIKLSCSSEEDLIINADDTYFRQVINNLISNSIKFTPEDGTIHIAACKDGDNVIFSLKDSGVGIVDITPEQMFAQEINKTTRGTDGEKGTGVGLAICKKIIDGHGFDITFKSQENQGTEFIITAH